MNSSFKIEGNCLTVPENSTLFFADVVDALAQARVGFDIDKFRGKQFLVLEVNKVHQLATLVTDIDAFDNDGPDPEDITLSFQCMRDWKIFPISRKYNPQKLLEPFNLTKNSIFEVRGVGKFKYLERSHAMRTYVCELLEAEHEDLINEFCSTDLKSLVQIEDILVKYWLGQNLVNIQK